MRVKGVAFGIVSVLASTALPTASIAQRRPTQFATASSQPPSLPAQAPAIATSTFPSTQHIPPQMMDPVHILVPGQTAIPPAATIGPVTTTSVTTASGQARFGNPTAPVVSRPAVGTSRNEVLRQFGQPSVTVITRTGETLYFHGGITVRLENGKVSGAR